MKNVCANCLYSEFDQDAVVEEKSLGAQPVDDDESQTVPSFRIRSNVHHDHKASILELPRASTFAAESPGSRTPCLANIAIPFAFLFPTIAFHTDDVIHQASTSHQHLEGGSSRSRRCRRRHRQALPASSRGRPPLRTLGTFNVVVIEEVSPKCEYYTCVTC